MQPLQHRCKLGSATSVGFRKLTQKKQRNWVRQLLQHGTVQFCNLHRVLQLSQTQSNWVMQLSSGSATIRNKVQLGSTTSIGFCNYSYTVSLGTATYVGFCNHSNTAQLGSAIRQPLQLKCNWVLQPSPGSATIPTSCSWVLQPSLGSATIPIEVQLGTATSVGFCNPY